MRRPLHRLLPLLAVLALPACGGDTADVDAPAADAPAAGTSGSLSPLGPTADEAAVASYTLTMPRVEGWARAVQNLQRLAEEDPALAETWETEEADPETFDEMIEQIEAEPRARRAIQQAGITPRDYVLTSLTIMQAMFAQAAMDMGQGATLPEGINPANVAFVREHETELEAVFASIGLED